MRTATRWENMDGAVFGAIVGMVALSFVVLATPLAQVSAAAVPRCSLRQLAITANGQVGAGGTDGGVLTYRNTSRHACSLTGYPNVVARGPKGSAIRAVHVFSGMLGGWDWSGLSPKPKPPVVVLSGTKGFASDWFQFSENGPAGYTLFRASTLEVSLVGSKPFVRVRGIVDAAEGKMWVTPFVPGRTGTDEPTTTPSRLG